MDTSLITKEVTVLERHFETTGVPAESTALRSASCGVSYKINIQKRADTPACHDQNDPQRRTAPDMWTGQNYGNILRGILE